ncbi:SRPBCC domain-containing protein [Ferruginibacter sp. SUN106]|uniref:SRPBCC domain-containing protein n=1 Tax=Ferruginibacter sp. SUN106 TaxID=2978348 RepID=UPI003D35DA4D
MAATTTEIKGRELIISRILNAPAALVWDAWTKPEHIIKWWGPTGFTTTDKGMTVKPGGDWRFMMHGPDGRDYPNRIVFIEVDPPKKLVYKHSGDNDTEPVNFHVTVTFENLGNKTNLIMHSVFESAAELERLNKEYGAIEGGQQHIGRLDEFVTILNSEPFVIERIYNAPVATVWQALTDNTEMKKWYFDIAGFKPEVGFEFSFAGQGKEGENYIHLCKVMEVIKEKKITYSWRYEGYEGNSFVTFELSAEGEKTKLKLTHAGLETFPATASNAFAKINFAEGWTYITGTSLKQFVEK